VWDRHFVGLVPALLQSSKLNLTESFKGNSGVDRVRSVIACEGFGFVAEIADRLWCTDRLPVSTDQNASASGSISVLLFLPRVHANMSSSMAMVFAFHVSRCSTGSADSITTENKYLLCPVVQSAGAVFNLP